MVFVMDEENIECLVKRIKEKKKIKIKIVYIWNFDGFDYYGLVLVFYCLVVFVNREGIGEMYVICI